ncbi:MAG: PD-(D/E)XK nuclease family protein [Candidatus Methylomirabilales bacterium]
MAGPEALSASQLTLYLTCSLKYRFVYFDKLPELHRVAAVALGRAMHAALEWINKARKAGRNPPLSNLLKLFEADWNAQCVGLEIRFNNDEPAEKLLLKGKELLSQYYHLPQQPVKDAELYFQVPLVSKSTGEVLDVPLRGVIDLVEANDTLVEFKVPQKTPSLADLPDHLQLSVYSYAYEMLFGRAPKELRLVNLVRTKNPKIETQITGRDEADYERLFNIAKEVLKGIRAGVFIPNRGCWLCKDCPFDQDCREWSGNEE